MCRSKTSGKPILTICPMSRATSSTRSVIITKSLWPRISLACCASCTLMAPSSPKLELLGREHSNCTSWAQRTVDPTLRPPEITLLDFLYGEWGEVMLYFARADGKTFEIPVNQLRFKEQGSAGFVGGAATSIDGVISTRRGNAGSWTAMQGKSPSGEWELSLPITEEMRNRFKNEEIEDILLVITYSGRTAAWPA